MKSAIGRIGIRGRIFLLALLPLFVLTCFAVLGIGEQYRTVSEMRSLEALASLAVRYSAAIHEMQKERGISAGFLASKGKEFATKLEAQRQIVDSRFLDLREAFEDERLDLRRAALSVMERQANDSHDRFTELRSKVTGFSISPLDAATRYSAVIDNLLDAISHLVFLSHDIRITRGVHAYVDFLNLEEQTGLERAFGVVGFSSGTFSADDLRRFSRAVEKQSIYLDRFRSVGVPEHVGLLERTLREQPADEIAVIRRIVLGGGSPEGVEPTHWFELMTIRIEMLKQVEDRIAADLRNLARDLAASYRNTLLITLLAFLATVGVLVAIGNSIVNPLVGITDAMSRLAHQDLATVIPGTDLKDEIGALANAAAIFRDSMVNLDLVRRRLSGTQRNALDAIITIDATGAVVDFNPSAEALFGYRQDEIRGRNIAELIIPESLRASHREGLTRYLDTGTSRIIGQRMELPAMRSDGSGILVELTLTAADMQGEKTFTAFVRDITKRKQAEASLTRALADQAILGTVLGMSLQSISLQDLLRQTLSMILARGEMGAEAGGAILVADPVTRKLVTMARERLEDSSIAACVGTSIDHCNCVHAAHAPIVGETGTLFCFPVGSDGNNLAELMLLFPAGHTITQTEHDFFLAVTDTLVTIISHRQTVARLRQLSRAVEQSPGSVVITDTGGKIQYVNRRFVEVTGYSEEEILGQSSRLLRSGRTPPDVYRNLWETISSGRTWYGEFHNRKKNGELYWEQASISPITEPDGTITHYLAVKEDVTQRKEYEALLLRQAHFDSLTNLPNRLLAMDRLSQALAHAHRKERMTALLFVDLDHFKRVNDTLGHIAGDELLRQTATRLTSCMRESDTVARMGGDEFIIILPDIETTTAAELVADKILQAFSAPYLIEGQQFFITPSIGISIYPIDDVDAHDLLRNADAAMYQAKAEGRGTFRFFTPKLNELARENMRLEQGLRQALERGELKVHYQPLVELASGNIVGVEALLRWNSAELGSVPPDRFIHIAEDTGLILPIGDWVVRTACAQLQEWQRAGMSLFAAVNISGRQFLPHRLAQVISSALESNQLSPDLLEVEITESILLTDSAGLEGTVRELENIGVTLSMDDFGTGYSSLSYLRRFHFHTLKIDRSFISGVASNVQDAGLVSSIIAMGHGMGLKIIGEGIETPEQLAFLREAGCDIGQGWLFGKAMDADTIRALGGSVTLPRPSTV
ncbi:MAG: EAL domain-containing protein [Alphaproteobacteria bacterium]